MTNDSNATHDSTDSDAGSGESAEECLIVEIRLPPESFALGETLAELSDTRVEFEQLVPTRDTPLPYLWVENGSTDLDAAVATDSSVERVRCITSFDDSALYAVEWADSDYGLLGWLSEGHATLLQADGEFDEWHLKLRFESQDDLGEFQAYCGDNDIDFELIRLFELSEPKMGQFNVSEKQFRALVTALEMGFFNIPRDATLGEVAAELGITSRAASERLRRGHTNVLNNSIMIGRPSGIGVG